MITLIRTKPNIETKTFSSLQYMHQTRGRYRKGSGLTEPGTDPATKVRSERFQQCLVVKSHNGLATVGEMNYTSRTAVTKHWKTVMTYANEQSAIFSAGKLVSCI